MLDPRIDLANMLHELREQLNKVEMKLWEIPHHAEPVEEYEAVFTAPAEGDYLHPLTPTHEKPEGFSDAAYWDDCVQCWMEPTVWEWDEYNYCDNANSSVSYDCEGNTWVEGSDWSNDYASTWYDYDTAATTFVEDAPLVDAPAEEHVEPAPAVDGEVNISYEEDAPEMAPETAPEMAPETAPEMAPEPAPIEEPKED